MTEEAGGIFNEASPLVVLRLGRDAEAIEDAVLLLSALGIPHEVVPQAGAAHGAAQDGVALVVTAEHEDLARRELDGLARGDSAPDPEPRLHGGARAGVPAAIALVLGHVALWSLSKTLRTALYAAGELDARRVRAGELFRVVTALTLHADPAHVAGNAVATAIFVSAAGDWVGPGVALLCTILAGAIGNLAAAAIDPGHLAIGFSTATFGALGLTAVFGFVARHRDRASRRRAWLALGAGVALLALLGAGERSDLLAHILGLVAGAVLGVVVTGPARLLAARAAPRRAVDLGVAGQLAAAVLATALVAGAWVAALLHK